VFTLVLKGAREVAPLYKLIINIYTMPEDKIPEISEEEAKKLEAKLAKDKKEIAECEAEIKKVLEKHGCLYDVSMVITHRSAYPIIRIVKVPVVETNITDKK
jgi:hypothetical protein